MIITKAPTRIDLAGGTLDIWPLSAIFGPGVCLNVAINLFATVTAKPLRRSKTTVLNALHLNKRLTLTTGLPENKKTLFHRAFEFFPIEGWEITVDCQSPAGAGLGGSSALLVALIRTFAKASGKKISKAEIVELAKNIEARHLGIPTGVQDYIAALHGGTNRIDTGQGGIRYCGKIPVNKAELEKRILLVYSGQSRISGKANWTMFKNAVEGEKKTAKTFQSIAQNSLKVETALRDGNFRLAGKLMGKENSLRESFGPAVIPVRLKKVFDEIRTLGAHPKICGAGGGGCFIVFCEPETRERAATLLKSRKLRILPFRIASPVLK